VELAYFDLLPICFPQTCSYGNVVQCTTESAALNLIDQSNYVRSTEYLSSNCGGNKAAQTFIQKGCFSLYGDDAYIKISCGSPQVCGNDKCSSNCTDYDDNGYSGILGCSDSKCQSAKAYGIDLSFNCGCSSGGLSTGAKVGISLGVIAGVVIVVVVVIVIIMVVKRRS